MTRTKQWKRTLIALCAVLLLSLFAMTMLFLIQNSDSAIAETSLDDNTAQYTLDTSTMSSWRYSTGGYWYNQGQQGSTSSPGNPRLIFHITVGGKFVFKWQSNRTDNDKDYTLKLTLTHQKSGEEAPQTLLDQEQLSWENDKNNAYYNDQNCSRFYTIESVSEGDTVTMSFETKNASVDVFIQPPQNKSNIEVSVAQDSQGFGQVKSDEQQGSDITLNPQWLSPISFKAVPNEDYVFTCWTDETGKIVKNTPQYSISDTFANDGKHFYAHFMKKTEQRVVASSKEDVPQWKESDTSSGKRYELDIEKYETNDTATITYEFNVPEGGRYFSFGYYYYFANRATFRVYLTDVQTNNKSQTFLPLNSNGIDDSEKISPFVQFLEEGYHRVDISFSSYFELSETDKLIVENFQLLTFEQLEFEDITFDIPEIVTVTMTYTGLAEAKVLTSSDNVAQVPVGMMGIKFSATVEKTKNSAIDPEKTVNVQFGGFSGNFESSGTLWSLTSTNYYLTLYNGIIGISTSATGTPTNYTLKGTDDIQITAKYKEYAPAPEVYVVKSVDGLASERELVTNGNVVEFEFGHVNVLTVHIKASDALTKENYKVTVNGVQDTNLNYFDGYWGLVMNDVSSNKVTVEYVSDEYIVSNTLVTFNVRETLDCTVDEVVHEGKESVAIEDLSRSSAKWQFDPTRSVMENYAFLAGASAFTNESRPSDSISKLKFDISCESSGVLTFEFQIDGTFFSLQPVSTFESNGAQFFSKFGSDFNLSYGSDAESGKYDWTADQATRLAWATNDIGGMDNMGTDSSVTKLENGWFRVKVNITSEQHELYLMFVSGSGALSFGESVDHDQYLAIRNINYLEGSASVSVSLGGDCAGTFDATAGADQHLQQNGKVTLGNLAIGETVQLNANLTGDQKVYGWFVNGEFYSDEQELNYEIIHANTDIVVFIQEKGYFQARIGNVFYKNLIGKDGAIEAAESGQNKSIILVDSISIGESFTIPSEVSLIIPYSPSGSYFTAGTVESVEHQSRISWADDKLEAQFKYLTLTLNENAVVTVQGKFIVGGVVYCPDQSAQGHTSGAYSHLVNNGQIVVDGNGIMDVYGRVTGKGTITVNDDGKLYEPFLILDYSGGNDTLDLFSAQMTPFRRYAMINIECKITINYGGQLIGHAGLWALSSLVTLDQPFISDESGDGLGSDTMIMLKPNSSVTITYDSTKVVGNATSTNNTELIGLTTLEFTGLEKGGAVFSYMQFSAMSITIPTTSVYFAIPYNFHIKLGGEKTIYETRTDFMILPGATVEVEKDATLHLHASAYVYDGLVQGAWHDKSYPTAGDLEKGKYSKNGNFIVNGKLIVDQKWGIVSGKPSEDNKVPATFMGIIQTDGTGTIEIKQDTILNGIIVDGIEEKNYFAYTSSARVWDAAHGCFGNLVAGRTYTATGSGTFTLDSLKYTNTKGGEENLTLALAQQLHGSWMVEHGDNHVLDWALQAGDDKPTADKKVTLITRKCSELGCTHSENKNLFYELDQLGDFTFNGKDVTEEDLQKLFKTLFGQSYSAQFADFAGYQNAKDGYTVTVTPDGLWYKDSAYEQTHQMTFNVKPYTLTESNTNKSSIDVTYNGTEQQPVTLTFNGQLLHEGSDYTITYQNNKDAGQATAEIKGQGNFAGEFTVEFNIKQMKLVYKAKDLTSSVGEVQLKLEAELLSGTVYDDGKEIANNIELALSKDFASAQAGDSLEITIKFKDGYTAPRNYDVELRSGTYNVINEAFASVTFDDLTIEYDGQLHKLEATGIPQGAQNVSYTIDGQPQGEGNKDIRSYSVRLQFTHDGHSYDQTRTLTITKRDVTVTVEQRMFTFDGTTVVASYSSGWYTQQGSVVEGEDLVITISGSGKDKGTYQITTGFDGEDKDHYNVTFAGATSFEIIKAQITVTLKTVATVYGETLPDKQELFVAEGVAPADTTFDLLDYLIFTPDTLSPNTHDHYDANDYAVAITVKTQPTNYEITIEGEAAYNVTPRPVTVHINDQMGGVYKEDHNYSFNQTLWSLDSSTSLASGEETNDLQIRLTNPNATNAGSYVIAATCGNGNYSVTFVGSWNGTDEHSGKAGTYTVDKKDLSEDGNAYFYLYIDGEEFVGSTYTLSKDSVDVTAQVAYIIGEDIKTLAAKAVPGKIESLGEQNVTVSIDDVNYTGSKTSTVNVLDKDGYTQNLRDVLNYLEENCDTMTADSLTSTQDTFNKLKQAKEKIDSLSAEEQKQGELKLAPYKQLLESWDALADVDETVIDTAEAIASAPIKGLMLVASLNALLAAAVAVLKGGIR